MLIATDLDSTIIYPAAAMAVATGAMMIVEGTKAKPKTGMTQHAATLWRLLSNDRLLIPATGRTNDQYLRLRMPGKPAKFAVTTLGAEILVDGEPDPRWRAAHQRRVSRESVGLEQIVTELNRFRAVGSVAGVYVAGEAYCVALLSGDAAADTVAELDNWAGIHGWKTVREGSDLYFLPRALDKQNAVAHLAHSSLASRVLAGGDSLLDLRMLKEAQACIRPAHGTLHEINWACDTATVSIASSVFAAEEILTWYVDQVGAAGH